MHQIRFWLVSAEPRWGAYVAPQIPSWLMERIKCVHASGASRLMANPDPNLLDAF